MRIPVLLASLASAAAAHAGAGAALPEAPDQLGLAQSLERRGLPEAASLYYLRVLERGPQDPSYARAVEGAALLQPLGGADADAGAWEKVPVATLEAVAPEAAGRLAYLLAISAYRAGRYEDAARLAERVPAGSAAGPRAQYLSGLVAQRTQPEKALRVFAGLAALDAGGDDDRREVKQLAQLALGRTLYKLRRYPEASAAYAAVPRFSRHWDEGLFEGAYADLRAGDPGAALGRLHSLRSPQLSDAFAPESENLAAIIYHRNCLWPQVRDTLTHFASRYEPMRDRVKSLLAQNPSPAQLAEAVDAAGALPAAVRRRVRSDGRVESWLAELRRIDADRRRIAADAGLMASALGPQLLDALGKQRERVAGSAGGAIREGLTRLARLVDALDGENEIVGFETLKGEKDFLEERIDRDALLAAQRLYRPKIAGSGDEYWQFEGEYWPDEVGYYRYTVKDACPKGERVASIPLQPESSQEDAALDALVDAKRDEMIAQLGRILPKLGDGERKSDLLFQLAELWWEKAKVASLREVRDYDRQNGAWLAAREKDGKSAGPEPKLSTAESDGYRKKALALYQTVLDEDPNYPRRDELLFVLAYNQYEIGDRAGALRSYQALIDQFPASRFLPDAYVQMGEQYFQHNDLAKARAAFERAASFRLPKVYAFAVYKLAWCDYNAHDYRAAIARFQEVVDYEGRQSRAQDRDRIQLKAEALKDIVLPFAQLDAIEDAAAYLSAQGGERAIELIDRLVKGYGPRSQWAKANASRTGALSEAHELTESALRDLVQDYHQEAIKTKNAATYRLARDIYKRYLDAFPDSESAYRLRFYYGEILYALEEWQPAAAQYARVAETDPKGEYAGKAAYDAILALEKAIAVSEGKLQKRELADAARVDDRRAKGTVGRTVSGAGGAREEEAIPPIEQQLVDACERYLRLAPHASDEAVIRYKAAYVFYQHGHSAEASRRFGEVVDRWPADPLAQKAADLALDILNSRQQWLKLGELAEKFHQNGRLSPPGSEFERRMGRLAEGARFKHALEIYEKHEDEALAARELQDFVARHPRSEYAPVALNDSVVLAEKADQLDVVIEAAERLLNDYPDAPERLQKPAMRSLAGAYERTARYAEAIRWYEQYASRWPGDPKAPDHLFNAALWREGLGDDAGALADWRRYLDRYGSRPDAVRIAFNVGLLLERQKDWKKAALQWREFGRAYAGKSPPGELLVARYKEGLARRELDKSDRAAAAAFAEVARRFESLPQAQRTAAVIDAAAHARFLLVEPAFEEFEAIRFRSARQQELLGLLKAKNARMAKLLAAYTEVIAAGSPKWSQAALTRLGEAYRDFNKGLLDAPVPRGLDAEQRQLYQTTLENQALPLEDKAVDAFHKAIEISGRTGSYSEWTLRAQERLREYRPDEVPERRQPPLLSSAASRAAAPERALRSGKGEGK